jgi:hypothetical protein
MHFVPVLTIYFRISDHKIAVKIVSFKDLNAKCQNEWNWLFVKCN